MALINKYIYIYYKNYIRTYIYINTSSTARGGGGSLKGNECKNKPEERVPIESFVTTASHFPVSHLIDFFLMTRTKLASV